MKNRNIIVKIDNLIQEATEGDEFTYFAPHSRNALYRAFISHPKCIGLQYIEDGMDAYLDEEGYNSKFPFEIPIFHRFLNRFFFNLFPIFCYKRLRAYKDPLRSPFKQASNIYGLSEWAFPYRENRVILESKHLVADFKYDPIKAGTNVFLLDAIVEQNVVLEDHFIKFIHWFALNISGQELLVKFHPAQDQKIKRTFLDKLNQHNVKVSEFTSSVPFELILFTSSRLNIFGIGSSLLVYASLFNSHEVYALYDYFSEECSHESVRLPIWKNAFEKLKNVKKYSDFETRNP